MERAGGPSRGASRVVPGELSGPSAAAFWRSDGESESERGDSASDDEDRDVDKGKRRAGPKSQAAEDPLFAADADDNDQLWADKQRQNRQSDAVLSCPCCFEVVTIDCQKHATIDGQWRAMFVKNVRVDLRERFRPAELMPSDGRRGSGTANETNDDQSHDNSNDTSDSFYHKALCATCGTPVGVRDEDEVYHLFDVFPTNA